MKLLVIAWLALLLVGCRDSAASARAGSIVSEQTAVDRPAVEVFFCSLLSLGLWRHLCPLPHSLIDGKGDPD